MAASGLKFEKPTEESIKRERRETSDGKVDSYKKSHGYTCFVCVCVLKSGPILEQL